VTGKEFVRYFSLQGIITVHIKCSRTLQDTIGGERHAELTVLMTINGTQLS